MKRSKNYSLDSLMSNLGIAILINIIYVTSGLTQCDPTTIDLCEIGNNSIIQACYHAQIAKTSNGYSITGEDFHPNGINYSTSLKNIPSIDYSMPSGVAPLWGAIGGRTQAVFLATDGNIYAIGEEDLLIDDTNTSSPAWGVSSLKLPSGVTVCDVNKWQGTAGSGSDNSNNSNATGDKDGFLVFSTVSGEAYITGDGAKNIQSQASNFGWTMIDMPSGVSIVNFEVGYRTLLILGSDGNLYASGSNTYLGDGSLENKTMVTLLPVQPDISVFGIAQIEAGFNSYFVLDGDGTIHVLGENSEGALGVGNVSDVKYWSKVGADCPGGALRSVAYISTMSTHDNRISSSAILIDGTIRSWGSNNKQSITTGLDVLISCPIKPTGNNNNAVAISNGGHISPYVNTNVQICNIGHNRQGAFGDGNDEEGDYGEYKCRIIPGMPEICGTKEADLALDKSVDNTNPSMGEDIIFTITVTNNGPEASTGSFVRDQLGSGFYYVSDDSNGDYNHVTGLWIVGPLAVDESRSLNITVKGIVSGTHSNYAQILVDNEVDINSTPGDNSANQNDDDLIEVHIEPCPINITDVVLCPDDSLEIGTVWIYESGKYVELILLETECDSLQITNVEYVEEPPMPQLDLDCYDRSYTLSVTPYTVWNPTWENGDDSYQTKYIGSNDRFLLTLESAPNCLELEEIELPAFADLDEIPTLEDTTILENSLLEINLGLDSQEWAVIWSPESIVHCTSCLDVNIIAEESTTVSVYLEHSSGCVYETSFYLDIEKAPEHIFTPNVFSPDGIFNNEWIITKTSNVSIEKCIVYDRWGN